MDIMDEIKISDARAIIRLSSRLHGIDDPVTRKQQFLDGACELVDAVAACSAVTHRDPRTERATVVSTIGYCTPAASEDLRPIGYDAEAPLLQQNKILLFLKQGPTLESTIKLPDSDSSATLTLYRHPSSGKAFANRDRTFVDLVHSEMAWIYQMDLLLTSPAVLLLSPRTRQTLSLLLLGLGEKQIALRLRLSQNTVHHYVKSLHRHFRVSSRSELLAQWVGK